MNIKLKLVAISALTVIVCACGGGSISTSAPSQQLIGIAVDNTTTPTKLYLTDYNLDVVQSTSGITGTATLSTVAGNSGTAGSTNATGTAASFNGLEGVVVDTSGNLFVSDANNDEIRKITSPSSSPAVTTFAGTLGTAGSTDATGTSASFNTPRGMVIDSSNNIYVADAFNQTIRLITSAGVVTTIAGYAGTTGIANGAGSVARFNYPFAMAIDNSGNLYVADSANHAIRKIVVTAGVTVSTLAGSIGNSGYTNATTTNALFNYPLGITSDGTNIYVCDSGNNVIRKIDSSGVVTTLAGSTSGSAGFSNGFTNGNGTSATFNTPTGISYGGGNLYVIDQNGTHVRIINLSSPYAVTTLY